MRQLEVGSPTAVRVYEELTDGGTCPLFLGELVDRAARVYPGLLPDSEAMAAERLRLQRDKIGLEIEQGVFLSRLLADEAVGPRLLWDQRRPTPRALRLLTSFAKTGELRLDTVHLERREGIAHVTVCNQAFLNAEDNQIGSDLETAVDLVLLDDEVEVAVVRGGVMSHPRYAGRRVFSSGMNLTHLRGGQISFVDFVLGRETGYIAKIQRGLLIEGRVVEKPWVAAVDTFAIGGGFQLLLVFDHVVADHDSYVSLPAVKEGIVPGLANLRLPRAVGTLAARRLVYGGEPVSATDSAAAGWFDDVVPSQQMEAAVDRAVRRLRKPATIANRRMLRLAGEPESVFRRYLAEFAEIQVRRLYSADVLDNVERAWALR